MEEKERSSTGLEENVAGFFCYLLWFFTGIIFLVVEKKSRFVKFHAMQSTITFLILFVILVILGFIPIINLLLFPLWILSLILWLFLMIKALQGNKYSLPIVGKMAEEKVKPNRLGSFMGSKRKKKNHKKGRGGRIIFLLVLIGVGLSVFYLFRQEIFNSIEPRFEKKTWIEKKDVFLYFSDPEGEYLIAEKRKIPKRSEVKEEAKEIISELIRGPKENLIPTLLLPYEIINSPDQWRGVAEVNFDKTLAKDHPGGSSAEMMTVYSIVNSLSLNISQIKRVQILIDGKPIDTITGHLSLRQPVSPKSDLIKRR